MSEAPSSHYLPHINTANKHSGLVVADKYCILCDISIIKRPLVLHPKVHVHILRKISLTLIPTNNVLSNDTEAYQ